jgi:hypothetical protein
MNNKRIKCILIIAVVFVSVTVIVLRKPNYYAPILYTLFSELTFSQQKAEYIENGKELKQFKVGNIPTSIDISTRNNKRIALVTSMGDSVVSIVDLNSKSGKTIASYKFTPGSKPRLAVWCDIDNDNIDELIVPLWGKGFSSVFVGKLNSYNKIVKYGEYNVGNRPRSVACGDLDGDGFNEIVTVDNFSNTLSIIDNNGALTYLKSINVGNQPGAVTIADFNGDHKNDLVVSHRSSNNIFVLIQTGKLVFEHKMTLPTLEAPKDQVVVDINNDGYLDVISADGSSNNISIFYIKNMKVSSIERIKVSGSPHSIKYITQESEPGGSIVVAGYPNWIETLSLCSGKYKLTESLWFGGWSGFQRRKILYLDSIPDSNDVYVVMAGIDSVVKVPVRLSEYD